MLDNLVFISMCSPNTCKGVFNPNVTIFQSNCIDGLQFSAFIHFADEYICRCICTIPYVKYIIYSVPSHFAVSVSPVDLWLSVQFFWPHAEQLAQ